MRIILPLLLILMVLPAHGRRLSARTRKHDVPVAQTVQSTLLTPDSLQARGIDPDDLVFNGFDKPATTDTESVFVTNNTPLDIREIKMEIDYTDAKGRQLHRREVTVKTDLPAGQTRQLTFRSWDRQRSFHYHRSATSSRRATTPFHARISLLGVRLSSDPVTPGE